MNNTPDQRRVVRRVLVTGSRTWTAAHTIRDALRQVWGDGDAVLVTGACPIGADRIAEMIWRRWGGQVERHPANWSLHGRSAGFRRNAEMVNSKPDVCVAFVRGGSAGASHTVRLAESAGIPTSVHTHRGARSRPAARDTHSSGGSSGGPAVAAVTEELERRAAGWVTARRGERAARERENERRAGLTEQQRLREQAGAAVRAQLMSPARVELEQANNQLGQAVDAGALTPREAGLLHTALYSATYDPGFYDTDHARLLAARIDPGHMKASEYWMSAALREVTDHLTGLRQPATPDTAQETTTGDQSDADHTTPRSGSAGVRESGRGDRELPEVIDQDAAWFAQNYTQTRLERDLTFLEQAPDRGTDEHVETLRRAVSLARQATDQARTEPTESQQPERRRAGQVTDVDASAATDDGVVER